MKEIKGAIFDLDGTVLDSMGLWHKVDVTFFKNRNMPVPEGYIQAISPLGTYKAAVYTKETYNIKDGSVIGRGAKADIIISDPFMSTVHAVFKKEDEMFTISDNNSTNGTFVNGERIGAEPCALKTGDLIKIGQLIFIFVEPTEDE